MRRHHADTADATGAGHVNPVRCRRQAERCRVGVLVNESLDGFLAAVAPRSEEHTSELQSRGHLVCRLLLEKKNITTDMASAGRRRISTAPADLSDAPLCEADWRNCTYPTAYDPGRLD